MEDLDFEGTLVLERLAEIGKLEDFFDAIDADNFGKAKSLMTLAELDTETISMVIKKMKENVPGTF